MQPVSENLRKVFRFRDPERAREAGRLGGTARWAKMTPEERAEEAAKVGQRLAKARAENGPGIRKHKLRFQPFSCSLSLGPLIIDGLKRLADEIATGAWDLGLPAIPRNSTDPCRTGVASQIRAYAKEMQSRLDKRLMWDEYLKSPEGKEWMAARKKVVARQNNAEIAKAIEDELAQKNKRTG